ncbi:hypothetical protein MC885_018990 [Smutsia gigantea]|nr:hypothetical protein MC885_018990 [Smutsia gigantea]
MFLQKEHAVRHQRLVEDAQKNHKVAVKFLKASLGRIREQERKERKESLEHMKQRIEAVLALKGSITANRRAQVEKAEILAQGGDAFRHLFHQRRYQELEAQNRAFEEEQKLRKQEIVSRILKEEAEEDARRKKARPPAKATALLTLRDKTWSYMAHVCEGKATAAMPCCPLQLQEIDSSAHPRTSRLVEAISSESVQGDSGNLPCENDTLAEPEIPGLWSEDYNSYQCPTGPGLLPLPAVPGKPQVPKEDTDQKPVHGTKMNKDILACTMEQLRSRVVHKQVVSGHEFKGQPFNSKPKLIHFKDFDIGKVYKKKIRLVNATYTINYCKLVGVEEHLKDFVHIE